MVNVRVQATYRTSTQSADIIWVVTGTLVDAPARLLGCKNTVKYGWDSISTRNNHISGF